MILQKMIGAQYMLLPDRHVHCSLQVPQDTKLPHEAFDLEGGEELAFINALAQC